MPLRSSVVELLRIADRAAEEGDAVPTLAALLEAWQIDRAPEIGAALLLVDADLASRSARAPPPEDWAAAARAAGIDARSSLLPSLVTKAIDGSRSRLEAVAEWGPDPRVAKALEELLVRVPWTSDSSMRAWRAVFALVTVQGDPRLRALASTIPEHWGMRETMRAWLTRAFLASVADVPTSARALTAEESRLAGAVAARFVRKATAPTGPRSEDDLLKEIWANPADDAPRLVLADLLMERGDPRGEFVSLQLAERETKRQATLLKEHGRAWLGRLAPVVPRQFAFRRGFVAEATLEIRNRLDQEAYGALPEWATLEALTWEGRQGQEQHCHFIGPTMRHVRRATFCSVTDLLAAKEAWAIESLTASFDSPAQLHAVLASPQLPRLTELACWAASISPLWLDRIGWGGLRRLRLFENEVGPWLERLDESPLEALEIERGTTYHFTRGSDGRLSVLRLVPGSGNFVTNLAYVARSIPDGALESYDVTWTKRGAPPPEIAEQLASKVGKPGTPRPPRKISRVVEVKEGRAVGWSEDGQWLLCDKLRAAVIDPETREVVREFPIDSSETAAFSEDGSTLLIANYTRAHVYDLRQGKRVQELVTRGKQSRHLALAPDGKRAVMAFSDATELWDLEKRELQRRVPRGDGHVALEASGERWALGKYILEVFRTGSKKSIQLTDDDTVIKGLAFSRPGRVIASSFDWIREWDADTGQLLRSIALRLPEPIAVSAGGAWIAADRRTKKENEIVVVAGDSFEIVTRIRFGDQGITSMVFSRDGSRLLVLARVDREGGWRLHLGAFDAASGRQLGG